MGYLTNNFRFSQQHPHLPYSPSQLQGPQQAQRLKIRDCSLQFQDCNLQFGSAICTVAIGWTCLELSAAVSEIITKAVDSAVQKALAPLAAHIAAQAAQIDELSKNINENPPRSETLKAVTCNCNLIS